VNEHLEGCEYDDQVALQSPAIGIFKIGLKTQDEVVASMGRTSESADLRQTGNAGLQRMTMPISLIDLPEQILSSQRPQRMRSWSDDAHMA